MLTVWRQKIFLKFNCIIVWFIVIFFFLLLIYMSYRWHIWYTCLFSSFPPHHIWYFPSSFFTLFWNIPLTFIIILRYSSDFSDSFTYIYIYSEHFSEIKSDADLISVKTSIPLINWYQWNKLQFDHGFKWKQWKWFKQLCWTD